MGSSTDVVPAAPGRERLVDQAYRQIRDAIVAVRLQPGAPLDEKALSASLQLGLTPIRDALKRLTLEKLTVIYPRRGTFVSRINIADEARLTEIRVELEGLAAALAAERATEKDRTTLLTLLEELEHGSHTRADHTELDARVHRAVYAATHNEFLEATLNQYANLALRIWNFCLQEQLAGDEHIHSQRAVVEAIVRGDALAARMAAEHGLREFSDGVRSTVLAVDPRQASSSRSATSSAVAPSMSAFTVLRSSR
jgi:DNA-binding GntR family transcriptional regulator